MVDYAPPLIKDTPSVVLSSSAVMAHRGWTDESCARYTVDQTAVARWRHETHAIADKEFHQEAKRSRKQQFDDTLPVPQERYRAQIWPDLCPMRARYPETGGKYTFPSPHERYRAQIWARFVPDEGAVPRWQNIVKIT